VISMIDFDTMTIPNGLILALIVPCILSVLSDSAFPLMHERLIGFVCVSVPLLIFALVIKGSFGGGDIKMMAICGFFLGWKNTLFATFVGFIVGGIAVVLMLAFKKVKKGMHIPFGPWLAIGVFVAMLWGTDIVYWYLSLLGLAIL
ncbi:MAG: A24 family peptidase, partial [Oscillospiraceae bacterium]